MSLGFGVAFQIVFVFVFSSSGASVVAIDNKIEQAMVSRLILLSQHLAIAHI